MDINSTVFVDGGEVAYTAKIDTQHNTYTILSLTIYGRSVDIDAAIEEIRNELAEIINAIQDRSAEASTPCNNSSLINGWLQYCSLPAGHDGLCQFGSTLTIPPASGTVFGSWQND